MAVFNSNNRSRHYNAPTKQNAGKVRQVLCPTQKAGAKASAIAQMSDLLMIEICSARWGSGH